MSKKEISILIVHGPNLNLLGSREPDIYGKDSIEDINKDLIAWGEKNNISLKILQSNHEGVLIDFIQENREKAEGILINPAAFTHTSYALRSTIQAVNLPAVEVHITNIHAREQFMSKSVIASVCIGQVSGFGKNSYKLGLLALHNYINNKKKK